MYPHCHPRRRSSRTTLNGTVPWSPDGRKIHPICTQFLTWDRGFPTLSNLIFPTMLYLHVSCQQPKYHLPPTLLALNPTPLPLSVRRHRSCHPSPVRRLRLRPHQLERVADHSDCLPRVSLQAHPSGKAYQGAEIPLEPSRVRRCDHTIVRVEEGILMSALLSMPTPLFHALHHHCNPVPYHRIHHHVENGGG